MIIQFLIVILIYIYRVLHQLTGTKWNITFQTIYRLIYSSTEWMFKWKYSLGNKKQEQSTHKVVQSSRENNRLLLLSNHLNMTDGFHYMKFIIDHYPEHTPYVFVKDSLRKLPFSSSLAEHGIFLKRNYSQDKEHIISQLEQIKQKHKKTILLIFPEGTTFIPESVERSLKWCSQNNIKPYNNTIVPRYKGLDLLLRHYCPDYSNTSILLGKIGYPDDPYLKYAQDSIQVALNQSPRIAEIEVEHYPLYHKLKCTREQYNAQEWKFTPHQVRDILYKTWREIDDVIGTKYKQWRKEYKDFVKSVESDRYHHLITPNNQLTWYSSKILFFMIPIAYITHGFWYALMSTLLLITSYQYHIYNKWRILDMILAGSFAIVSFLNMKNRISMLFPIFGNMFYMINLFVEKHIIHDPFHNRQLRLNHSMLHIMTYVHIYIEFLSKYMT